MDKTEWKILKEIAELEKTPHGAYNIRRNGELDSRENTANIQITRARCTPTWTAYSTSSGA